MNTNELTTKDQKYSLTVEVKENKTKETYSLAKISRIFFARLFDIIISAIPGLILGAVYTKHIEPNNINAVIVTLAVGLAGIILFFMIIPMIFNGNTIGKFIFGVRLKREKGDNKIKFWMIIARESFFLIIPWVVPLICFVVAIAIMNDSKPDDVNGAGSNNKGAYIVYQLGYIFFLLWFLIVGFSIKVQPEHQSGIDLSFGILAVNSKPDKIESYREYDKVLTRSDKHASLTDMPGNFTEEAVNDLKNDDKKEFGKSISLDDLDIQDPKLLLENKDDVKSIENKDKEDEE